MPKLLAILALVLLVATPTASADSTPHWVEVRSDHFTVITDSNEKEARHLAGQFERMRSLFHRLLPSAASDAPSPIIVFALKDKKGFGALEPPAYLQKNALDLAGLFLQTPDQNYILLRLDSNEEHPFATVYHEYTHFILRKAEYIPLWLGEGLAEFYQNTDIHDKDVALGQPSTNDILYLRENKLLPLDTLFRIDHSSPYYHDEEKGSVFYAESWAFTHMIEVQDFQKKTSRLADYALLLKKGGDPVTAAQQVFGDLTLLKKQLDGYVSQSSYSLFRLNSAFTADESTFKLQPVTVNDVNALRADVLAADGRQAEAKTLLDATLAADPNNALAHESMGSLCYMQHDESCAKKYYGEAIQLDSGSYLAHYFYAVMSMQDGTGHDGEIESSLRTAIKLNPTFAPPYDALARFYGMRHENLEEAYKLSVTAIQIEPEMVPYRINAAENFIERDQLDNAIRTLDTAAKIAKTPADIGMVQSIRVQVKQRQESVQRMEAAQKEYEAATAASSGNVVPSDTPAESEQERTYPIAGPRAPHHIVKGTIRNVKCSYPTVMTFTVEGSGKPITLFSPNYFKVPFTTVNFVPTKDLEPCKQIQGMTAKVDYAEVTDRDVAGQITSVELSK
jgi:tetratricopeptide (TPR) repeat protein